MNNNELSKKRHDIVNQIASVLAQLELLKRQDPQVLPEIQRIEEKVKALHLRLLSYFEQQ